MKSLVDERELRTKLSRSQPEVQAAIADYVRQIATKYAGEVLSATLCGSQALGQAVAESDIYLFVVVRRDIPSLREALADLAWQVQFEYGVVISDIIRSVEQLSRMQAMRFAYYRSVEEEGILLWKSPPEAMPAYA